MPIRLLIIDDEEIIRNIFVDFFAKNELFSIETAVDGNEGLKKIRKNDFDIVITDLNMPGISGLEVVEKVKKMKPEIEVIIMTAFGTIEFAVDAMKRGAYDFILKPIDFERTQLTLEKCYQHIEFKRENKDLKEINVKLKELNEEKEKFITITSHELRTPVNAISGLTDMIIEGLPEEIIKKYSEEFKILSVACNNLKDLVTDMHELSLAKSRGLKVIPIEFNIKQLEDESRNLFRLYSLNRNLNFQVNNLLKEKLFFGDKKIIMQAVGELIQNAVKFTKDGGTVDIKLNNEKGDGVDYLTVTITDSGIGIAADQIDKIFDAFYEVQDSIMHHSSKTEFMGGGIGIGLSIVQEITQALGGKITVESESDRGSKFKLYLPYKK